MKKRLQLFIVGLGLVAMLAAFARNNTPSSPLQVEITGIAAAAVKNNVSVALDHLRETLNKPVRPRDVRHFAKLAPDEIKAAMQPFGYFRARIHTHWARTQTGWIMHFTVNPGPRIVVTSLSLKISGEGKNDLVFSNLKQHFPIKIGKPLNIKKYENAKQKLFDLASQRGYFQAKMLNSKIIIDLHQYQARIAMHFDTGPRYFFGPTTFSPSSLNVNFLKRYLTYQAGSPFNSQQIQKTQQGLASAVYFDQVLVMPEPKKAKTLHVPVAVMLKPSKSQLYMFGLGYDSTTSSVRGTIGIHLRRVNSWGHRFNFVLRGSRVNSSVLANYIIPGSKPATDFYIFKVGAGTLIQSTGTSRSTMAGFEYHAQFGDWTQVVGLTYLNENYNLVGFPNTTANLVYPSIRWRYLTTVDDQSYPRHGLRFDVELAGTPTLGGPFSSGFFQGRVGLKALASIKRHTRFLFRLQYGYTAIDNINNLPLSLQLFAGGARSIRGFGFNSIGPGQNLIVGSVEVQERVYGKWYIAAFYDAGNVSNNLFKDLFQGVGPGLVWLSPVGPIEVDVANAISQPNRPWRIQFTVGPNL